MAEIDRLIVHGMELETVRGGAGRPIVLLHGFQTIDREAPFLELLGRHGLDYDAQRSEAIAEARRSLRRITVDAALMVHEDGASVEEAEAYVERWSLSRPAIELDFGKTRSAIRRLPATTSSTRSSTVPGQINR